MGAVPDAVRVLPESMRSAHPQASVTAVGAQAEHITSRQTLGFAPAPSCRHEVAGQEPVGMPWPDRLDLDAGSTLHPSGRSFRTADRELREGGR
ncbi:AAC(3) family N-acetyltransferase [Streptomyces silaceus]|uniref:AAC(3) family N-acetyltransferase n=1 Tax=Streptomyces silaceus TaxID=545123 RepID=UPI0006EBD6A2